MAGFEELKVWQECRSFRREISSLIKTFPKTEQFDLVSQLKRASRTVTANISEGYGRYHYQENIQFCRQVRGSLEEVKDHLYTAFDEGYLTANQLENLFELQKKLHQNVEWIY